MSKLSDHKSAPIQQTQSAVSSEPLQTRAATECKQSAASTEALQTSIAEQAQSAASSEPPHTHAATEVVKTALMSDEDLLRALDEFGTTVIVLPRNAGPEDRFHAAIKRVLEMLGRSTPIFDGQWVKQLFNDPEGSFLVTPRNGKAVISACGVGPRKCRTIEQIIGLLKLFDQIAERGKLEDEFKRTEKKYSK